MRLKPHHLLFAALLLAGLFTFRGYGQSWDEPLFYRYAAAISSAYAPANWLNVPESAYGPSAADHKYYGPAYLLAARPLQQSLQTLFHLEEGDAWHLVNFIGFWLGLMFFFRLARRTLPLNLASLATAFFALQPVFWGHAFLNPKDIPFMTAFLAAMTLGLDWADAARAGQPAGARLIVAAFALGAASAIRVIGPLAGLLVGLYLFGTIFAQAPTLQPRETFSQSPKLPLYQLPLYAILSALVMLLLWPFLWQNPLTRLLEVLAHMSDNPTELAVLFLGQIFRANEMPTRYFPQMLALTLTLPTWPLALIGFWRLAARRATRAEAWLHAAWFGLVAAYILLRGPAVYDGFRHFFFILPPIFVFAGHGFEALSQYPNPLQRLRHPTAVTTKQRSSGAVEANSPNNPSTPSFLHFILALLLILPGLLGIFRLHPYEYTYYNALTGGTGGAYRVYETDYWLTCYREALTWARQNKPEIPIYVQRELPLAQLYGEGLTLLPLGAETPVSLPHRVRTLFSTRADLDVRSTFRGLPAEKEFGRAGAIFCSLKWNP